MASVKDIENEFRSVGLFLKGANKSPEDDLRQRIARWIVSVENVSSGKSWVQETDCFIPGELSVRDVFECFYRFNMGVLPGECSIKLIEPPQAEIWRDDPSINMTSEEGILRASPYIISNPERNPAFASYYNADIMKHSLGLVGLSVVEVLYIIARGFIRKLPAFWPHQRIEIACRYSAGHYRWVVSWDPTYGLGVSRFPTKEGVWVINRRFLSVRDG